MHCPNCNAPLDIPENSTIKTFVCNSCQSTLSLFQNSSISSLEILSKGIEQVSENTNVVASELTLVRLEKELEELKIKKDILLDIVSLYKNENHTEYEKFSITSNGHILSGFLKKIYEKKIGKKLNIFQEDKIFSISNASIEKIKKYKLFFEETYKNKELSEYLTKTKDLLIIEENRTFSNKFLIKSMYYYIELVNEYIQVINNISEKQNKIIQVKEYLIS